MILNNGTPGPTACASYLRQAGVPQILVNSGDSSFSSSNPDDLESGYPMAYSIESSIVAQIVKKEKPNARVGILSLAGDAGDEYVKGFENAINGSGVKVVSAKTYGSTDPSVNSQMAQIISQKPDVFLQFTAGKYVAQALTALHQSTIHPIDFIVSASASVDNLTPAGSAAANGVRSIVWAKDPSSAAYESDSGVKLFKSVINQYGQGTDLDTNLYAMQGFIGAELFVDALKRSQPTVQSLMSTLYNLRDVEIPGLQDGVTVSSSKSNPFMITSAREEIFNGKSFVPQTTSYSAPSNP